MWLRQKNLKSNYIFKYSMTLTGMTSKILQDRRTGWINEIVGCEIMLFSVMLYNLSPIGY